MTAPPPIDDAGIDVVARRVDFLEHLRDGPKAVRDIVDEMDHSRSTVNRALTDLASHDLVEQVDGGYATTLTGSLTAAEHREYRRRMTDLLATDAALAPLAATAPVDRAAVVGARTQTVADSGPVAALEPAYEALSGGERLRILLPSLPSGEFLERLETALVDRQAEAQVVVGSALLASLDGRVARSVVGFERLPQCQLRTGPLPSYGLVVSGREDASRLTMLVFDAGQIHGVLTNEQRAAVAWGTARFEDRWADADPLTDAQVDRLDSRAAAESFTASRETRTQTDDGLPYELRADGWTAVDEDLLADRTPVDPAVGWRTGLGFPEIRAGYAVPRERPTGDGRQSLDESLVAHLTDGDDVAVVGPPGSGKSTLCKSVAYDWFEADRGPVFYRESGTGSRFDSPVLLEELLKEADGHALVVVEDVMRSEANSVLEVAASVQDRPAVSFLFDSRESEWTDAESQPLDARVESYRSREIEAVTLPSLDDRERERFVDHFERLAETTFGDVHVSVDVPDFDADENDSVGETLLLSHRLSSLADPTLTTESVPSSLDEEIRRTVTTLRQADSDVALDVAVLASVLNASGVGVYPELLFSLLDVAPAAAVRDGVRRLEGTLLFADESREPTDRYRSVHGFWSSLFLRQVADRLPDREAQERFGRAVTALLSVADSEELRDRIGSEFEGSTPYLDAVAEEPVEWVERTVEQVFAFGRDNPGLTGLYGKTGYSEIDLPELTSPETRLRCIELRGEMARTAGMYDRAEKEFSLLVDPDEATRPEESDTTRRFEVRGLKNLAYVERSRGNYERASEYAERGLELGERLDYTYGTAGCLNELGAIEYHTAEYEDAVTYYEQSLDLRRRIDDTLGEASTAANLGTTKMLLSEFDAAEDLLKQSLSLRQMIGDRWGAGVTLDNLGVLKQAQGEFQEAAYALRQSLDLATELGAKQLTVHASGHLCEALIVQGSFEDASRHLENCDQQASKIDYQQFDPFKHTLRAELQLYRGGYDSAVAIATRARDMASEMDSVSVTGLAREVLAQAHRLDGNLDAAVEAANTNIELRRELEEHDNVAESLVTLAEARIDQEAYDEAGDLLGEALDIAREMGASFFEARARRALGILAVAEDRPEEARDHLAAAVEGFRDGGALPDAAVAAATLVRICETLDDETAAERWRATRAELLRETDLDEGWVRRRAES